MTNSKRGSVSFDCGGTTYKYRLTTNNLCRYEDATGSEFVTDLGAMSDGKLSFRAIRAMLWAGLPDHHSIPDAGDILDAVGLDRAVEVISEGASLAFPADDAESTEGAAGNAPKGAKPKT